MNVLLMNVPGTNIGRTSSSWEISAEDNGIFPPVGLMYLASAIRNHGGHTVEIVDCMPDGLTADDMAEKARAANPDIVGLTVYTPTFYDAITLTRKIRAALPKVTIVWGGPHTMMFPEESMAHQEVDLLFLGEAEETFPGFLDRFQEGDAFDDITGIVYRKGDEIVKTGPPGYVKDINIIKYPAWDLLESKRYYSAIGTGLPMATICSSRGCPFQCTYCCRLYGTYRSRKVDNIIEEMQQYYSAGFREFLFFDDLFNITTKRVVEVAEAILDKGWDIQWTFRARVDQVTEDMVRIVKAAGCRQILFGVEDATNEGLALIKKKIKIEQVAEAIELCRRNGIMTSTNWLIGLPHHTSKEDILHLLKTAIKIDPDFAQFNILRAYHGTEIFNDGVSKGLFGKDVWRDYVLNPIPAFPEPIWTEHLSQDELTELMQLCYKKFYFRPKSIWRKLLSLRRPSQLKLYIKGALTLLMMRDR